MLIRSALNLNTHTQTQWEQDLVSLTPSDGEKIWRDPAIISKSVRYRIIQIKICHRAYITPAKLTKMDPSSSDLCWHGCGQVGTLIHVLWHCPAVKVFLKEVVHSISLIIKQKWPLVHWLVY